MGPQARPVSEVWAESPDVRHNHGQRHPAVAILALACRARLAGYRSETASAAWGRHAGAPLGPA